jgi:hypothetical protein
MELFCHAGTLGSKPSNVDPVLRDRPPTPSRGLPLFVLGGLASAFGCPDYNTLNFDLI